MNRQERRRAAKTNPPDPVAEGFARYRRGDLAGAETCFRAASAHPEAMRMLGEILADTGRHAEAIALLSRLISMQPHHFEGFYALGNAFRLAGRTEDAIRAYQAALVIKPGFAGLHHGMGLALRRAEREDQAITYLRETVRLVPDWGIGWRDYGLGLAMLGDLPGAAAALARAVALAPGLGDAHRHLAALRATPPSAADLAELGRRAANPATPPDERIDMYFALGRLAEKSGDHDAAFRHYAAGNALLRGGNSFDRARLTRDIDRIIATFTPAARRAHGANPSAAPVFMVGMPRAGSSLFEQLAASHSAVFGAGEQTGIGAIAARIGWAPGPLWTQDRLAAAAQGYLAPLQEKAGGAARILDKMPDNIFQLGLISALFPNARVIFCERDARDIAISCFFQRFAQPYGFDTDLADCRFRNDEVNRLAAHWQAALPLRWMSLSYETLLAEPEAQSRRLIAFLGLDWEPQCLDFHQTARPVRTASWAQVRQPLYQSAAGKWRHFTPQLAAAGFETQESGR